MMVHGAIVVWSTGSPGLRLGLCAGAEVAAAVSKFSLERLGQGRGGRNGGS